MNTLSELKGQAVQLRNERDKAKEGSSLRQEFQQALRYVQRKIEQTERTVGVCRIMEGVMLLGVVRLVMVIS